MFQRNTGVSRDTTAGINLIRPGDDIGPASKVLFATKAYREKGAQILFCDDDKIFHPTWSTRLFETQTARPGECVAVTGKLVSSFGGAPSPLRPKAERAAKRSPALMVRRIGHKVGRLLGTEKPKPMHMAIAKAGYVDILQGLGGAVVRPEFFDDTAHDIPDVLWAVDDVWLSGLLATHPDLASKGNRDARDDRRT